MSVFPPMSLGPRYDVPDSGEDVSRRQRILHALSSRMGRSQHTTRDLRCALFKFSTNRSIIPLRERQLAQLMASLSDIPLLVSLVLSRFNIALLGREI